MQDALIISDIHLGADNSRVDELQCLLEGIRHQEVGLATDRLILNGDVFDSFDMRRLSKSHWKVLSLLRKLTKHLEVHWITGNHDHNTEALSLLLGVEVHDEFRFTSGNRDLLCLHGHRFDSFMDRYPRITAIADGAYQVLQWIDRSHSIARLAKKSSKTFLRCSDKVKKMALAYANRLGVDVVCCGHTHFAEEFQDPDSGIQYFNSGSWVELPCTFLTVKNGLVELRSFANPEIILKIGLSQEANRQEFTPSGASLVKL